MINFDLLRELERTRTDDLCRWFFPNGRKVGNEWRIADTTGAPGNSLGIQLTGPNAGLWHDRATGAGGDFIKLLCENRNLTFPQAIGGIERALEVSLRSGNQEPPGTVSCDQQPTEQRQINTLKLKGLERCNGEDLQQISNLRSIPIEGLQLATERKLLFSYPYPHQGRCWLITDDARRNAIARRLDGKPFGHLDPETDEVRRRKTTCIWGSEANWPIGAAQSIGFPAIALCEGAPDFLAAFYLAWTGAVERLVAPVCMTGAACPIHKDALPLFRRKRVRIFGHADEPGEKAIERWADQLESVEAQVDGFFFAGLLKVEGSPVKDLNDFILADHRRSGCPIEITTSAFDFGLERADK
jgi:hypothetical protein